MLPRHIPKHVQDQNWVAVALDDMECFCGPRIVLRSASGGSTRAGEEVLQHQPRLRKELSFVEVACDGLESGLGRFDVQVPEQVAVFVAPAAALQVRPATFDTPRPTSNIWSTADRIADGERRTASDWDAFFSHPGYAVTESSGQRRSVITHCMPAVFAPDGDVAAAKEKTPEGEGRLSLIGRVCDHMVTIAERRSDIEAWLEAVDGAGLVEAGKQAAARYLSRFSDGAMEGVRGLGEVGG